MIPLTMAAGVIAVEVERITENQRFVMQLLSKPEPVRALDRGRNDPAGT
ncbi:MAG: hypothetical protein U9Q74_01915 [Gemmatimonadota bacterium]|nr:hypothetical protein [Gemmatimonadota bacterium]